MSLMIPSSVTPNAFKYPPWKSIDVPGVDPLIAPEESKLISSDLLISASRLLLPLSLTVSPN